MDRDRAGPADRVVAPDAGAAGGLGFPGAWHVEHGYDEAKAWRFPVAGWRFTGTAGSTVPIVLQAPGNIVVKRLRITATELGPDELNNFYFQLAVVGIEESTTTALPFETSAGGDVDARLNQMWFTYGSISDGTTAVVTSGNEPSYHEWMALKYAWSAQTAGTFQQSIDQRLVPRAQSSDGYMWSWGTQGKWPTGDGSFHQDNNPKHLLALWRAWAWTRDEGLFDRVDTTTVSVPTAPSRPDVSQGRTIRAKAREALDFLLDAQQGSLGGIIIQDNGMGSDGTTSGDPTNYWDNHRYGCLNGYDSIYYVACPEAMAQLEDHWGDPQKAAQLRAWRESSVADYIDKFWEEAKGRYIATIDKEGTRWDFGMTFQNLEALAHGIVAPRSRGARQRAVEVRHHRRVPQVGPRAVRGGVGLRGARGERVGARRAPAASHGVGDLAAAASRARGARARRARDARGRDDHEPRVLDRIALGAGR